jgi:NAD(P)-dependent dehydrogenase (short-subunit alcohol dehydrogenase family)
MPKEKLKQFCTDCLRAHAQHAEIAPIFVFLASDQASYVIGEVYGAVGGQMPI